MKDFLFVDLSLIGEAKKFDGMAAGVFTDMWGRETEFKAEDLPVYVANTKRALESTRDAEGQIVGFPIDAYGHVSNEAAGWIVDVDLAAGREVVEFTPRWNKIGEESIGEDIMRYFSPTIDIKKKVILGGSLTNWPATRTEDHQILLRPVELSSQIQTCEPNQVANFGDVMSGIIRELKSVLSGLKQSDKKTEKAEQGAEKMDEEETKTPEAAAIDLSSPDIQNMIEKRAEEKFAAKLAEEERKNKVTQLADRLIGGTPEKPVGLPIERDKLVEFLESVPEKLYSVAEEILVSAASVDRIDFSEAGHSRVTGGTQPLPEIFKPALTAWLAAGRTLADFFEVNSVELGAMSDYNLIEFESQEKK